MKSKILKIISTISLALVMIFNPLFAQGLNSEAASENLEIQTRTVSANEQTINLENAFSEFESGTITVSQNVTKVEGIKSFKLSDFEELDLVSETNADEEVLKLKYNYEYNNQTNQIILSVTLENEETVSDEDKMIGYAFINESGNIDAAFDCEGETILLSELQEAGLVENCGFFSKLIKKTVSAVKKAVSTTAGKVITAVAGVAAVAVGVIGAVVAAPALAVIAVGAAVGAAGLSIATMVSTSIKEGKIDWEAVGLCSVVGAVAGGILAGLGYGLTKAVQAVKAASAAKKTFKYGDKVGELGTYVKNPKIKVNWSQTTQHATQRMAERNMSQSAVNSIVKNGYAFSQGGGKYMFLTKNGVAVVTDTGKLITTYGKAQFDDVIIQLLKLL